MPKDLGFGFMKDLIDFDDKEKQVNPSLMNKKIVKNRGSGF